jgi:hypothetical protein
MACADLADDHPHRDPHAADSCFAAHDIGLLGDTLKLSHEHLLLLKLIKLVVNQEN